MDKVINPRTGYWITKHKDTYNKLIHNGYVLVDNRLLLKSSLPTEKIIPLLSIDIVVEEIASHLMNPGHVIGTCKAIRETYHKEWFWKKNV